MFKLSKKNIEAIKENLGEQVTLLDLVDNLYQVYGHYEDKTADKILSAGKVTLKNTAWKGCIYFEIVELCEYNYWYSHINIIS